MTKDTVIGRVIVMKLVVFYYLEVSYLIHLGFMKGIAVLFDIATPLVDEMKVNLQRYDLHMYWLRQQCGVLLPCLNKFVDSHRIQI